MPSVDLVIPVYNEEATITLFYQQLCRAIADLPYTFRIIFVNDGSGDGLSERLQALAAQDPRLIVLELSRNFGQQAAVTAGLDYADADYVISLDGDGEHPPELIGEMLSLASQGYEVVLGQRARAQQAGPFKRWTSDAFYTFINSIGNTRIVPGSGEFRLLARPALLALRQMPEYHRFLRGMVAWIGFRSVILPYIPAQRLGGQSKYSVRRLIKLALDATFSFSLVPLYAALSLGGLFLLLALLEAIYVLSFWVTGRSSGLAPGWSSLMFVLLFVGGTIMVSLGILGAYLGYIFQEVKRRPIYLIRKVYGAQHKEQP
ncbi:MAG: glycosyltransferase family 2 protein [Longilinea sp.]|nr:glycosyltransferase family 2 protein [Longilinea sp.]